MHDDLTRLYIQLHTMGFFYSAAAYIAQKREADPTYNSAKFCNDNHGLEAAESEKLKHNLQVYEKTMMEALIMKINLDLQDDNLKKVNM